MEKTMFKFDYRYRSARSEYSPSFVRYVKSYRKQAVTDNAYLLRGEVRDEKRRPVKFFSVVRRRSFTVDVGGRKISDLVRSDILDLINSAIAEDL